MDADDWMSAFSALDWQGMQNEWIFRPRAAAHGLPRGSQGIRLWRDESYQIQGELTGIVRRDVEPMPPTIIGDPAPTLAFDGIDGFGSRFTVHTGYLDGWPATRGPFRVHLSHVEVTCRYPGANRRHVAWLTEWYLNGPRSLVGFPRVTERRYDRTISRTHESNAVTITDQPMRGSGYNYAVVQYGGRSFAIQRVPKEFGPSWSANIGIEYRTEWGGIPALEERAAIAEIAGFVMGRPLINVGHTEFDVSGTAITEFMRGPFGDNTRAKCERDGPIMLNLMPRTGGQNIEDVLHAIIPAYLEKRGQLHLQDAIWRADQARDLAIGIDLPALASALQGISNALLSVTGVAKGYVDEDDYLQIIRQDLESLDAKLTQRVPEDVKTIILNKIRGAWRTTSDNEKLTLFFREIDLPVSRFEKKAIAARNSMDHGGRALPTDLALAGRLRMAYHGLFQRTVLKILGYDSTYIDLTTPACPTQHIRVPQAGI